jgi:hypothetical protein
VDAQQGVIAALVCGAAATSPRPLLPLQLLPRPTLWRA